MKVETSKAPIVEIDNQAGAVYVRFQDRVKVCKTLVRNEWPLITVDLDKRGHVIGVEAVGCNEFTITSIMRKAEVSIPAPLANRARYVPTKRARFEPVPA